MDYSGLLKEQRFTSLECIYCPKGAFCVRDPYRHASKNRCVCVPICPDLIKNDQKWSFLSHSPIFRYIGISDLIIIRIERLMQRWFFFWSSWAGGDTDTMSCKRHREEIKMFDLHIYSYDSLYRSSRCFTSTSPFGRIKSTQAKL